MKHLMLFEELQKSHDQINEYFDQAMQDGYEDEELMDGGYEDEEMYPEEDEGEMPQRKFTVREPNPNVDMADPQVGDIVVIKAPQDYQDPSKYNNIYVIVKKIRDTIQVVGARDRKLYPVNLSKNDLKPGSNKGSAQFTRAQVLQKVGRDTMAEPGVLDAPAKFWLFKKEFDTPNVGRTNMVGNKPGVNY